jgi:trimeric autotransporter adhesin
MSERRKLSPAFIIVVLLALVAAAIQSQRTAPALSANTYWTEGFHLPGVNGPVHALAVGPDGSLYAGGEFTIAGGVTANHIARWDGVQWHPLGSGVAAEYRPSVNALAIGPDGSLYVGGSFTTAGGVAAKNVARWDGATSSWQPLGAIMNGTVYALAAGPDGSLYAGGWFTRAGGWVATNRIARWDGARWRPLGSGIGGEVSRVNGLAVAPDGSLYAGGEFTLAGGIAANHIARWDGATSSWHPLGSGVAAEYRPSVNALTFGSDGSLYAGGIFATAGGVEANSIARWDGARWHPLGSGIEGKYSTANVKALTFGADGSLYAGGSFATAGGVEANKIARWDGALWHPVGADSGMVDPVSALALGPDGSLYAGIGSASAGSSAATRHIARWDGATSSWHPVGTGSGIDGKDPFVSDLTVGPDGSLYAGGSFTTAGGVEANNIARWDGARWHPLGNGREGRPNTMPVQAMAFGPDGSLYVGGNFTAAGRVAANYIARWDGATSSWHPLGSGLNGSVNALAFGPDGSLYVGGWFTTAGGVAANRIARWDGALWRPLASGMEGEEQPYSYVSALAFGPDGSLYAGGRFTTAGEVAANGIARWDGVRWHPLGSGMGGEFQFVFSLAVGPDGSLYAGGNFTTAGGIKASYIARWDGVQWHPLGRGMSHTWGVYILAVGPDGSLYAGGDFSKVGKVMVNNIARWDSATSSWHTLGSGMNTRVSALAVGPEGLLYVGGGFTTAGGKPSAHIAQWTELTHLPAPAVSPDQSRLPSDASSQEARTKATGDNTFASGRLP